jgi:hypothetical protein
MARPKERLDGKNRMEGRIYDLECTVRTLEAQVRALGDVVGALRAREFTRNYGIADPRPFFGLVNNGPQANQAATPVSPEGAP